MVEQGEQLLGAALTLARQLRGSWTRWKVCRSWTTILLGAELPTTWTGCTSSPTAGSWASRVPGGGLAREHERIDVGWSDRCGASCPAGKGVLIDSTNGHATAAVRRSGEKRMAVLGFANPADGDAAGGCCGSGCHRKVGVVDGGSGDGLGSGRVDVQRVGVVGGGRDEFAADRDARHPRRSSRSSTDLLVICARVASLAAVGVVLADASSAKGAGAALLAGTAIVGVALSWFLIHTLFMLRYALLYYTGPDGGIDFNQDDPARYIDFAYLAFTVGMTFQVSDTDLKTHPIRATALRHALLSYLFGAVILATTINLVAGLSSGGG